MLRDKSHSEQIERWVNLCKKNMPKAKKQVNELTDAQIKKANSFWKNLTKLKGLDFVKKLRIRA